MHQKRRMTNRVALSAFLFLAACGSRGSDGNGTIPAPAATQESDDRVECAIGGGAFERACTVERTPGDEGLVLTVRAPNGSFRRLLVTKDGRGVVAADGAEPAKVTVVGPGRIEVAIGSDRYRLPATVRQ